MWKAACTRLLVVWGAIVAVLLIGPGCASQAAAPEAAAHSTQRIPHRQLQSLRTRTETQQSRIRELEGRLSLIEAQAKQLEDTVTLSTPSSNSKETVVVRAAPVMEAEEFVPGPESSGPRPLLRLYGAPAGGNDQLGTSPDASLAVASPLEQYRQALLLLTARKVSGAVEALSAFVAAYPEHPYADNALYWRGVAYYVGLDYGRALADFHQVLRSYPKGNKRAEALLNVAYCHARMGHKDKAKNYFKAVQRHYPDSVAARVAAREGAT